MKLPYVSSASCTAVSGGDRRMGGVMTITDTNFDQTTVLL